MFCLFIVGLFPLICCIRQEEREEIRAQMTAQIDEAKIVLDQNPTDYRMWMQYAHVLHAYELNFHPGEDFKAKCLSAFNKALDLGARGSGGIMEISALLHKAVLEHFLGNDNSIRTYSELESKVTHGHDLSVTLVHKAQALLTFHRDDDACNAATRAIDANRYYLKAYDVWVDCLKRREDEGKSIDWTSIMEEINVIVDEVQKSRNKIFASMEGGYFENNENPDGIFFVGLLALSRVADKAGNYAASYRHLKSHNKQQLIIKEFDADDYYEEVKNKTKSIINVFTPNFWDVFLGYETTSPVFIVGLPRCGSTLLETILNVHPDVVGLGEESIFNSGLTGLRKSLVRSLPRGVDIARGVVHTFAKDMEKKMLNQAKRRMRDGNSSKDNIDNKSTTKKKNIKKTQKVKRKPLRVIDKMLTNYRNIGFIHLIFPNATIINLIRDPMDAIYSIIKADLRENSLAWTMHPRSVAHEFGGYLQVTAHFRKVLPGRVLDVRYEDLVRRPRATLTSILERMNLSWHEDILSFHKKKRIVQTRSSSQIIKPLNSESIGAWRRYTKEMKESGAIKIARKYIEKLSEVPDGLPFMGDINWDLDEDFDYDYLRQDDEPNIVTSENSEL
jgi:hypothetical protein